MSDAAEKSAQACTHPEVKRSVREFYEAIAREIPEGQTTTGPIALDVLAAKGRQRERTARTNRDVLVRIQVIKVHDGGRGNKARYEMLDVTGTRPMIETPLPLRADLQPVRRTKKPRKTSDLFADVGEGSLKTSATFADVRAYDIGKSCRRWVIAVQNVGKICRRWWDRTKGSRKTSATFADVGDQVLPLDGTRARGTYTLKEHTHAPPALEHPNRENPTPPPCRYAGRVHAWCGGRVHVPRDLHRDFLRKYGRRAGERDTDVEATLFAFYAKRSAALPADEPIVENDFTFWRRAFAEEFARAAPRGPDPDASPALGCGHVPSCSRWTDHRDRIAADARAARERKSG